MRRYFYQLICFLLESVEHTGILFQPYIKARHTLWDIFIHFQTFIYKLACALSTEIATVMCGPRREGRIIANILSIVRTVTDPVFARFRSGWDSRLRNGGRCCRNKYWCALTCMYKVRNSERGGIGNGVFFKQVHIRKKIDSLLYITSVYMF